LDLKIETNEITKFSTINEIVDLIERKNNFKMKIIDLSLPIDDKAFEVHKLEIERTSHKQGVQKLNKVLMGRTLKGKIQYLLGKRIIKKMICLMENSYL